jgi:hypothetical protein
MNEELVLHLFPVAEAPPTWTNRGGKEVPINKLDNNLLVVLLDRLYSLAVVKQEMAAGLYEGFKGTYFQQVAAKIKALSWRDFADQVFFDLEYEAATRHLNWEPKPLTTERKINLSQRGALERYLVGALRDSINAHGPITRETAPSAAKRLIGAIKTFNHDHTR